MATTWGDVLTPAANFSFLEARDRSIEIEIVDGITAQVAAECDLEMLDSLRKQCERARPGEGFEDDAEDD